MSARCELCGAPICADGFCSPGCRDCALDPMDAAEDHEEWCTCEDCERIRSRVERDRRAREAATYGGLSQFGLQVLGWAK